MQEDQCICYIAYSKKCFALKGLLSWRWSHIAKIQYLGQVDYFELVLVNQVYVAGYTYNYYYLASWYQ